MLPRSGRVGIASLLVAATLLLTLLGPGESDSHPAWLVVDSIWTHLGGRDAFKKVRYIEFTFAVEQKGEMKTSRQHTWDRHNGDYVLEFTDAKTKDTWKIQFNIDSKKGVAFKNGSQVGEDENAQALERAYAIFCNDTYWLLAPTKLEDPGAKIQFMGHAGKPEAAGSEGEFVVLHVFFDKKVGVTPGDQYWFNVTHSGVVHSWRYVLESGNEGEWLWTDEKDCGMGIRLSTRKVAMDGNMAIVFPQVKFSATMDRSRFQHTPGS